MRVGRRDGVVLALVLILALVLSTAIITFMRRATMDAIIVHNRDRAARAETLARGGIQLALALILQDSLDEQQVGPEVVPGDTLNDGWARIGGTEILTPDGGILRLSIRDTGSQLNLNALVDVTTPDAEPDEIAVLFLNDLLGKVIDEIPGPPGERSLYDARELAENLVDYIDPDEEGRGASSEDDYYLSQDPPYRSANRPLLSVDEIGMVKGFDRPLVDALRPYVTVFPLVSSIGINLNTAPPHVLAALYYGEGLTKNLAREDEVRRILKVREEKGIVCDQHATDTERCTILSEVGVEGEVFPPTGSPASAGAFVVTSRATVGDMERTVEAVIDRSKPSQPRLLSWRVR